MTDSAIYSFGLVAYVVTPAVRIITIIVPIMAESLLGADNGMQANPCGHAIAWVVTIVEVAGQPHSAIFEVVVMVVTGLDALVAGKAPNTAISNIIVRTTMTE